MNEQKVDFLLRAASVFSQSNNKIHDILRSHYLLRCKNLARESEASEKRVRCVKCRLEWKNSLCQVKSIKRSKNQKRRKKSNSQNKIDFHCKELVKTCLFCGHNTTIPIPKVKRKSIPAKQDILPQITINKKKENMTNMIKQKNKNIDVYRKATDVFSLKDENNLIKPQQEVKVIKNNKKKKDKFAGLCQKAVLASAKMKANIAKQNKLTLFLKPS